MAEKAYAVEVQSDYLERITQAKPINALAELIWNSLDADATRVEVCFEYNELDAMTSIIIKDNGLGMTFYEAENGFTKLGGSWKKTSCKTKSENRFMHGKEGRGRFKAFTLGRFAEWNVIYNRDSKFFSFVITMNSDNIGKFTLSDETKVLDRPVSTGVRLVISEIRKDFRAIGSDAGIQELTEMLALYLANYPNVFVIVNGKTVDPNKLIVLRQKISLSDIFDNAAIYPVELEIIHWRDSSQRVLYLCDENGFPLTKTDSRFQVGNYHFSAYIKSSYMTLLQEGNQIELLEMNEILEKVIAEAQQEIKNYFRNYAAEQARSVVDEWKETNVYPFEGDAKSAVEAVERQVFDIVAVSVVQHIPDFSISPEKNKALHLQLLRQAISKSPEDLQIILGEVLKLPKRTQSDLAVLLKNVSLSSIINAAKTVADRQKFLAGLDIILFDTNYKNALKERSQLHQIVAQACWVFGEEYGLSVSDRSLTEVLRKHKTILKDDIEIDSPVKPLYKERGIVDLMLSRAVKGHRINEVSHLVVELKAPKVKVGRPEIGQIEEYALAVMKDERFRSLSTRWDFWLICDEYDDYAEMRMDGESGRIDNKKNGNFAIYVKTWAQILEQNRVRLKFFQDHLEYSADKDDAIQYLHEHHAKFLKGLFDNSNLAEDDVISEEAAL